MQRYVVRDTVLSALPKNKFIRFTRASASVDKVVKVLDFSKKNGKGIFLLYEGKRNGKEKNKDGEEGGKKCKEKGKGKETKKEEEKGKGKDSKNGNDKKRVEGVPEPAGWTESGKGQGHGGRKGKSKSKEKRK